MTMGIVRPYRLSENQQRLIPVYHLDSRGSIRALSKIAGVRESSARDALRGLLEQEILQPYVLVNIHALGYLDFCIFLSIEPRGKNTRAQLLKFLKDSPQVVYVAELAGEFQYSISFVSKNISELDQFLIQVAKYSEGKVLNKTISVRTDWHLFNSRQGSSIKSPIKLLHRSANVTTKELRYEKILNALTKEPLLSLSDLADRLRLPASTVRYQLKYLESSEIILGYPNWIDVSKLGMQTFRFLISENQTEISFRKKFLEFAKNRRQIVDFVHTVGNWDYELNVQVYDHNEIPNLTEELYNRFGDSIRNVQILAQLQIHKLVAFPFSTD
jgi:DNA-binding Lrp family transcriptional regulator